jgi:hypothetical protein
MPKNDCTGIYDNQTGLWLLSWGENPQWGTAEQSPCWTDEQLNNILTALGNPSRFIGQNPRPR